MNEIMFSYGYTPFRDFIPDNGWRERKIRAFSQLGESIAALGNIAAITFLKIPRRDSFPFLKYQTFTLLRACERITGLFLTLFNDRIGTYLVEDAAYNLNCYTQVVQPASELENALKLFGHATNHQIAQAIPLTAVRDANEESKNKALNLLKLEKNVNAFEIKIEKSFDLFLKETPDSILSHLSLADFLVSFEESKLSVAILSDTEFSNLTLAKLENLKPDQGAFLKQRATKLPAAPVPPKKPIEELTLTELLGLNAKTLLAQKKAHLLAFARKEQLQGLKLPELEEDEVHSLFMWCRTNKEYQERFACFHDHFIFYVINNNRMQGKELSYLPDRLVKKLKFSKLTQQQIDQLIFPEMAKRLNLFTINVIEAAIIKGTFTHTSKLRLLTSDHLKKLNLSKLPIERVEELFPVTDKIEQEKKRFEKIQLHEVQKAIENKVPTGVYRLSLLSPQQLHFLKLSKLPKEQVQELFCEEKKRHEMNKERFLNLSTTEVQASVENNVLSGSYRLGLLSPDHLSGLKLSKVPTKQINDLFKERQLWNPVEEDKFRFSYLSSQEVQGAIERNHLTGTYRLSLLSPQHLSDLKLSKLSEAQIDDLFYKKTDLNEIEEDKKRFACLSSPEVQGALEKNTLVGFYRCSLLSLDHLSALKLSNITVERVNDLFNEKLNPNEASVDKNRFACLSAVEVNAAIKKDTLIGVYRLRLLSSKQLNALTISSFQTIRIKQLFAETSSVNQRAEDRIRFSNISSDEVQIALESAVLSGSYPLSLLSYKHLNALKLSKLQKTVVDTLFTPKVHLNDITEDKIRFENLAIEEVQSAIEKNCLTGVYPLSLLSSKQLSELKLSRLSKERVKDLFAEKKKIYEIAEDKKRLALIPKTEVANARNKQLLNDYIIGQLV